jgi:pyruvate/2-oxoglutarate dehydrogenase complex dihydrolipoamide dehydrogenase (E3) component
VNFRYFAIDDPSFQETFSLSGHCPSRPPHLNSNYRIGETTAATKILIDRSSDKIVGAHLLGPEYAELVNTLALAMKLGLTTRQLKSITAAYPTVGSDLGSML